MYWLAKKFTMILVINLTLSLAFAAQTCPDMKKLTRIGKELVNDFKLDVCATGIKPEQIRWLKEQALPQLINKDFLGVEPPPHWQIFADELVHDCYQHGDLCSRVVQEKLVQCVVAKIPTFMLVFGSWFSDNCEKIDRTVIQNWGKKKVIVDGLIRDFAQELEHQ